MVIFRLVVEVNRGRGGDSHKFDCLPWGKRPTLYFSVEESNFLKIKDDDVLL